MDIGLGQGSLCRWLLSSIPVQAKTFSQGITSWLQVHHTNNYWSKNQRLWAIDCHHTNYHHYFPDGRELLPMLKQLTNNGKLIMYSTSTTHWGTSVYKQNTVTSPATPAMKCLSVRKSPIITVQWKQGNTWKCCQRQKTPTILIKAGELIRHCKVVAMFKGWKEGVQWSRIEWQTLLNNVD